MTVTREIETGDQRPRVSISIEAAVTPKETVTQELEALHEYIIHHLRDWFGPDTGLTVAVTAEEDRGYGDDI